MIYFSIVIPVYNRPKKIINALESIRRQSEYSQSEVIIVDDSTDSTTQEIKKYKSNFPYIKIELIKPQERAGPSKARNIGIKSCKGKVVIFFDSDDKLMSGSLEEIRNVFEKTPDLSVYFGKIKRLSGNIYPSDNYHEVSKGDYVDYIKTFPKQGEVLPVVRRSELLSKGNGFHEQFWHNENLLYLRILKNGGNFLRGKNPVRLYDDISLDRLCEVSHTKNKNMRDAYLTEMKDHGFSYFVHSKMVFLEKLLKIIIYNRLIDNRKFYSIQNFISFIICPLPKRLLLKMKSSYTTYNMKKGRV